MAVLEMVSFSLLCYRHIFKKRFDRSVITRDFQRKFLKSPAVKEPSLRTVTIIQAKRAWTWYPPPCDSLRALEKNLNDVHIRFQKRCRAMALTNSSPKFGA